MIADGIIQIGAAPEAWGFTRERFAGDSYLWKDGEVILISFIESVHEGRGHFSALVRAIEASGFRVAVPTPLGKMVAILSRWGWKPVLIEDAVCWMNGKPTCSSSTPSK